MDKNEILQRLIRIPLFSAIKKNDEYMNLLVAISTIRKYRKGEMIIKEGDIGAEMYIVLSGNVEILKRTRAGDDYTVTKLKAEHNVFFGELALIDDDKRSATVIASSDSEFLVMTKEDFISLGDRHPAVGLPVTREIAKIISSRLRKTTGDMLTIFDALVTEIQG
ncbi:MAG: cyclic nucleotide-binding domain-containing protein [Spirochaetales bacterium]|nr:cyclic nucleotide-binding domain-containing protein [Spirochaetales bacterium]